ncbi:hypothetical protein [Variovorax gossypii]
MTEKSKRSTTPLTIASVVSLLILVIAAMALRDRNISQALFTSVLGLSVTLGLLSIAGFVETLMKPALGFESFRWGLVSALAFVGYLSRVDAVNDINAVFHIDAAALPLTTIAATVLRFATYMQWPMGVVFFGSVVVIGFMFWGSVLSDKDDIEKLGLGTRVFAAAVSSGLALLLILTQLDDAGIKAKIYRVAHKADFVSSFNCEKTDPEQFSVLFIGPEQRRVLLAPKIQSDTNFLNERDQPPELMQPVKIPTYFQVMDCSPGAPPSAQ